MTDEEMAEEYAEKIVRHKMAVHHIFNEKVTKKEIKAAVMYGLKAGKDMAEADLATVAYMQGAERYRPKWHKVADGDLPPVQKGCRYSANILTDEGDIAYYDPTFNTWWYAYEQTGLDSLEIDPSPVAWFELPKYTEE